MSKTQIGAQAPENSMPSGGREIAFFSSFAITFQAMMEMIEAEQKIMTGQASLAQKTTMSRVQAIQASAAATENMYNNDAQAIRQQANGTFCQAASSFAQAGTAVGSGIATRQAGVHSDNLGKLNSEFTSHPTTAAGAVVGDADVAALRDQHLAHFRSRLQDTSKGGIGFTQDDYAKIMEGGGFNGFDLRKLSSVRFRESLGDSEKITLQHVIESAPTDEIRSEMRVGVGKAARDAGAAYKLKTDQIRTMSDMGNGVFGALTTSVGASYKISESQQIQAKAAEASIQAQAQSNAQVAAETAKSQSDQAAKMDNLSGQAWGMIQQMVSNEYRG